MMLVLVFLALLWPADSQELSQKAYLDADEQFLLEWRYTDTEITFTATVKTTGWFGIGFSPNGGMAGSDIIVAWVDASGKAHLQDMYAEKNEKPFMDKSQDVTLKSGVERDGSTVISFSRKLDTCDQNDMPIVEDTMKVIYAMSVSSTDVLMYHQSRKGSKSLLLRRKISAPYPTASDNSAITIDYTVKNIEIPSNKDTRYYCELMKAPSLPTKYHLIQVDPIIHRNSKDFVHHIILYGCYDNINREKYFANGQIGYDCYDGNMPYELENCRTPVAFWGIGGTSSYLPAEAGIAIGDSNSPKYFVMEIHYDNPQKLKFKYDDSGLKLVLTRRLRSFDAGILPVGNMMGITVPPGAENFQSSGFCSADCTRNSLKEVITVFGVTVYGRSATKQVTARHFRNGREMDILDADRHYDSNYQQYKNLDKLQQIWPGDDVMVTCHYDTKRRTTMTYGGLFSASEMCIAFLYYYPIQDITDCFSAPEWVMDSTYLQNTLRFPLPANNSQRFDEILNVATERKLWTEEKVRNLQEGYLSQPQYAQCNSRRMGNQAKWYNVPAVSKIPAPTPKSACVASSTTTTMTTPRNTASDAIISSCLCSVTLMLLTVHMCLF